MEIDLNELKSQSFLFYDKLRFPIESLCIKINNKWKKFKNFISETIETDSGYKFKTELKKLILDTGNEAKFIVLSAYYLETFKKKIQNIDVKEAIIEDFRGNQRITKVSLESFKFKLYHVYFYSKIGFTHPISLNTLEIINIGINSIKQFLNIIFRINSDNFYYCRQ